MNRRWPTVFMAACVSAILCQPSTLIGKDAFIYCRSGNRSTVAANILMGAGFTKIHNLRHGIIEWERKNLTVIR